MKPRNREEAARRMQKLAAKTRAFKTIHKKAYDRRLVIQERLDDIRRQQAEHLAAFAQVRKEFEQKKKDFEATKRKLNNARKAALKECVDARTYEDSVAAEHNKFIWEMNSIELEFDVVESEASTSTEEKIKSFGTSLQFSLEATDDEMSDVGVVVPIEDASCMDVDSGAYLPALADRSADVQSTQPALNSSDSASPVFGTCSTSSATASLPHVHSTHLSSCALDRVAEPSGHSAVASGAMDASVFIGEKVFVLIGGTFFPAIVASVHRDSRIGLKLVDNNGEPHDAIRMACAKDVVPMTRFRRNMKMDVRVWIDGCACGTRVVIRKKPDEKGREFFELEDMTTKDAFKVKWNVITFRWERLSPDVLQALTAGTEADVDDDE